MIEIKLSAFEGPMDLLLHLIERAEMDIQDIFVSEITEQYLTYMDQLGELDMDTASEFLAMAAALVYIKSRALLPHPAPVADEDEEDPEEKLIRQIREYKAYKQISEEFSRMAQDAAKRYARLPEEYPLPSPVVNIQDATLDQLMRAFTRVLRRENMQKEPPQPFRPVRADAYTIGERMEHIVSKLERSGRIRFSQLFTHGDRMAAIVTFMALLELVNTGQLSVQQENLYGDIVVSKQEGIQKVE